MRSQYNWRDHLPVHPAAELFPLMSEAELRELGEDISKNGLQSPIIIYEGQLLDGRNRLDAMVLVGIKFEIRPAGRYKTLSFFSDDVDLPLTGGSRYCIYDDAYDYVLSANIHRRHLTADQKRDLIAKVLKATPDVSNRQIAKQVKADDKTVASVRRDLQSTAEIPQLKKTVGADGKARKLPEKLKPVASVKQRKAEYAIDWNNSAEILSRLDAESQVGFENAIINLKALSDTPHIESLLIFMECQGHTADDLELVAEFLLGLARAKKKLRFERGVNVEAEAVLCK